MSDRLGTAHICGTLLLLSSTLLMACANAQSQEGRYLTDFVGKVNIPLDIRDPAQYNLSPAETGVVRQNMQRLRDLLIAQPTLDPPRGIEVDGSILIDWTSLCHEPPCPKVPVAFSGRFRFLEYFEVNGKPVFQHEAEALMGISVNNPDGTLGSVNSPVYEGIRDLKGHSVFFQPPKIGELGGYSLYRNYPKNVDILVLTKNPKPYWVPLTQEAFLLLRIRDTEEQLAKMAKAPRDPAGDFYREWMAKKPERDKDAQRAAEDLKKLDPQKAKQFLEEREKNELIMTEGFRKNMEQNPPQGRTPMELDFERRLAMHKEKLAAMTPAQRQAQVRYFPSRDAIEPDIVPMDSPVGNPLVIANPDFMNPALPRTAIQVIAVFFKYGPQFDPTSNKYNESKANPANLRLRDMEQKSNWRAVGTILSGP